MKSLIVYYSYSGNTKIVAEELKDILKEKGEVEIHQLKPTNESDSFFVQAASALLGKRAMLSNLNFDLSDYDLICIGTPVWAFAPTPAINTFLDKSQNLNGKHAICFTTYYSGAGIKRCINEVIKRLKKKGVFKIASFNIQQMRVNDTLFVEKVIRQALNEINPTPP